MALIVRDLTKKWCRFWVFWPHLF